MKFLILKGSPRSEGNTNSLTERHLGYDKVFMDEDKAMRGREFCDILIQLKEI